MKKKIIGTGIWMLTFVFAVNIYAASPTSGVRDGNQIRQQAQTANQGEYDQTQKEERERFRSDDENVEIEVEVEEQEREANADEHRSAVANFVQGLLQIADSEGGIGQEVRTIAQEQNQSATTTIQAMERVKTRSKITTFLFGSDYKNLGALRSEMVKTESRIRQLNSLMERVENEADKTEFQNQIQTLTQEQTKIENFIKAREETFSLFGWLVKLFNK